MLTILPQKRRGVKVSMNDEKMRLIMRYFIKHKQLRKQKKLIHLIGGSLENSSGTKEDVTLAIKLLKFIIEEENI